MLFVLGERVQVYLVVYESHYDVKAIADAPET